MESKSCSLTVSLTEEGHDAERVPLFHLAADLRPTDNCLTPPT